MARAERVIVSDIALMTRAQARIRRWSNTNTPRGTSQYGMDFSEANLFGLRGRNFTKASFRPMSSMSIRTNCLSPSS